MKSRFLIVAAAVLLIATAGASSAEELSKAPPPRYQIPEEHFGYIPPPVNLEHLKPARNILGATASSWDWRNNGGVTGVRNQNPYGTCWAFATTGCLESQVLIGESYSADYSEINIQACNLTSYHDCNAGGNAWISVNYLAQFGTVQESCDPYPGGCPNPTCINPSCDFYKRVREWRIIPNDVTSIKNAVQNYGPVYTAMYASFSGFGSYDGSTCLSYSGTEAPNHAVLIVGWDDDMCGGNGAWIVKNSWGTSWGDNGYFYIEYGSARIGTDTSIITEYTDYDPTETVYYYDEWGWWQGIGYGDGDDWGLIELTHDTANEYLKKVALWATSSPANYTVNVYDDFSGGSPSNLLAGPVSFSVSEAGYYTVDLPSPLLLVSGDPVYIEVEFNTGSYTYPVPYDSQGAMETNKCFISNSGTSYAALDNGNYGYGDIGIRGIIGPLGSSGDCSKEGVPDLSAGFPSGTQTAVKGESWCYDIYPANSGASADTFCLEVYDTRGWTIGADPAAEVCRELNPGNNWTQQICVVPPCSASAGELDTVYAVMAYCDPAGVCSPDCGGNDTTMVILSAAEAESDIFIDQANRFFVVAGQPETLVPFDLCNPNPCAPDADYSYEITSSGYSDGGCAIPSINETGNENGVGGGECRTVYASVDASAACIGDTADLQIIAWVGTKYDTCHQIVEVIEPRAIPVFSDTVMTVLVLALILAGAIIIGRKSASSENA